MRRIILVLTMAAVVVVAMVITAPALAQTPPEAKAGGAQAKGGPCPEAKAGDVTAKGSCKPPPPPPKMAPPPPAAPVAKAAPPVAAKAAPPPPPPKALPKTGGITPGVASLAGLGAAALLVGSGLVVRRIKR